MARAETDGYIVEQVTRGASEDWTSALMAAIKRPGAAPIALASIASVHWSDGGIVDLDRIAPALRAQGAGLLVDATQSAGVLPLDVRALDPDFVVFPTYKWLIGPYGRAFLYVAKRHQSGVPLEQTSYGRRAVQAEQAVYFTDTRYVDSARRFDMGERDHFISLEMASIGIEMMTAWGDVQVAERLGRLTEQLSSGLRELDIAVPATRARAPHILSLDFSRGMPDGLVSQLAAERVFVAPRLGRLRISPHVYNDEEDCHTFLAAIRRQCARR
jgi:selenocysteine lyase/cysteine desulfurase